VNRIKELRIKRGWTQTELGNALNVKDSAISKYESERVPLTADTIRKVAKIFNVSSDYILCLSDTPNEYTQILSTSSKLTKKEDKLIKIFNRVKTEEFQEKALSKFEGYIDCLAELDEDNITMGKDVPYTPSKKNVG